MPQSIPLHCRLKAQISTCLLLLGIAFTFSVGAQVSNGVLFLKKNDKTIKSYFPGQDISLFNTGGGAISGNISKITKDSLYLTYYQTAMVPTFAGTRRLDTLGIYPINLAIKEIGAVPNPNNKRNVFTSGYTYMIAGGAYLIVNAINTTREKQPYFGEDNIPRLLAGIAGIAFGYLLERLRKTKLPIGDKYTLVATD